MCYLFLKTLKKILRSIRIRLCPHASQHASVAWIRLRTYGYNMREWILDMNTLSTHM